MVKAVMRMMLNKSGESGYPCLVPDLRGNAFSFSWLSMMSALSLSYKGFIRLRYVVSMSTFWRLFFNIINGVEFCQNLYLHLLR